MISLDGRVAVLRFVNQDSFRSIGGDLSAFGQFVVLLAQAAEGEGGGAAAQPQPSIVTMLPFFVGVFLLWFFLFIRPERRKQASQKAQLEALKKNDRVVTIGGIKGVVMSVERESDEVVLKVDEANNTKLRVTLAAISRVLSDDAASEKSTS